METPVSAVSPPRKCLVLILDGLGDLPAAELQGQTPLEAAETPIFSRLAGLGVHGLVDPVAPGVTPNTHSGVGLMFGLPPEQRRLLKRGPVEAAGAGLKLKRGDIAFRANFATLEERGDRLYVKDRRAGRVTHDSAEFAGLLQEIDLGDGVMARFQATDQHRGVLLLSGPGLGSRVGNTDPGDGASPGWLKPCLPREPGSAFTAHKVNQFIELAHARLKPHPLNRQREHAGKLPVTGVITRGAGGWFDLDDVLTQRGIQAALVVGCNTVAGLGHIFNMSVIQEAGFSADENTDIEAKLTAARAALERYPLVYVHIKATDLFAHDFQPAGKRDFIERIDRAMHLLEGSGAAIALTADHTTNSNTGAHTEDPVPVFFYTPSGQPGGHRRKINFGETACRRGTMERQTGHEFLLRIADYLDS